MLFRSIGKASFLHRSLSATAHIFVPLTAIGIVSIGSLIKLPSSYSKYLKYLLAGIFVYFAISVNMANASKMISKNTYNPYTADGFFVSLNKEEYEASQWILENAPASANISVVGIPSSDKFLPATSKKIRWLAAASQHVARFYDLWPDKESVLKSKDWYIMLDYTMLGPLNDKETFNNLQLFEKNSLTNHTLVYDKNSIRVYKFESK